MTKYQRYFQEMMDQHKELFASFKVLHDQYQQNQEKYQHTYNEQGAKVVEIIRDYEKMLCAHSESGQYGKFANTLADKFWQAVRGYYPMIDFVGVT